MAVDKLKDYKAPGIDNILGEDLTVLLKADSEDIQTITKNVELPKAIQLAI